MLLLRALVQLSAEDTEKAEDGFTALELVLKVNELGGRVWIRADDAELSRRVRKEWDTLLRTDWSGKREGVEDRFRREGYELGPMLDKIESKGGSGRPSRYRILWVTFDVSANGLSLAPSEAARTPRRTTVAYTPEDVRDANLLARAFARGYGLSGWRLAVLFAVIFLPSSAVVLLFMAAVITLQPLAGLAITVGVVLYSVVPLFRVVTRRIVVAPWWMQDHHDSRLLEHRYPPRYPKKSIKAVRYTSVCPVCQGRVLAVSGSFEFWGRIVGRCEHAPGEHVFSFDHITRSGNALR